MLHRKKNTNIQSIYIYLSCVLVVCSCLFPYFSNLKIKQNNVEYINEQNTNLCYTTTYITTTYFDSQNTDYENNYTEVDKTEVVVKDRYEYSIESNFGVFKSYTDYKCLSKSSNQWKLQEKAYTDENGLRKIGNSYLVAMGSYYGNTLGDEFIITLSNGNIFEIILCDFKQDTHTDNLHRECLKNGSVLEFYVDTSVLSSKVKTSGTIGSISFFDGSIVKIEKK